MPAIHLTFCNASTSNTHSGHAHSSALPPPASQQAVQPTTPRRRRSRRCSLNIGRNSSTLCAHVTIARTFVTRLVGLLAHRELLPGHGLWLQPSNGIHTMFMRFSIDVIALDRNNTVLKTAHNIPPWRIVRVPRKTRSVLELPAGHLRLHPVAVGDQAWPTYV